MIRIYSVPAAIVLGLVLTALGTAGGCQTVPASSNGLEEALGDYEAGHYSMAHRRAMRVWRDARGTDRDQAAYVAGLSALQNDDLDEAELRLSIAARSHDRQLAGQARASLGMVHLQRDRQRDAGRFFAEAAELLSGEEAREALRLAREAGYDPEDPDRVLVWRARGTDQSENQWHSNHFALQVGVYNDADNAEDALRRARKIARQTGHGPVRLVEQVDSRGRMVYVVQIGRFDNRQDATSARRQIGRLDLVVTSVTNSSS